MDENAKNIRMLTITDQMKIDGFDFHCVNVDNCDDREAIKRGAKLIKDHGGGDLPVHKYEYTHVKKILTREKKYTHA